jgi:hypothetical protein
MEPEGSLLCSQQPTTGPYPEPVPSTNRGNDHKKFKQHALKIPTLLKTTVYQTITMHRNWALLAVGYNNEFVENCDQKERFVEMNKR